MTLTSQQVKSYATKLLEACVLIDPVFRKGLKSKIQFESSEVKWKATCKYCEINVKILGQTARMALSRFMS